MENRISLNENPASCRCSDKALLEVMENASADLRAQETEMTKQAVKAYEEHSAYCDKFFERNGYNCGGWNAVFSVKDKAAMLAVEAVSVENAALYCQQWTSGAWQAESWTAETIERLRNEDEALRIFYRDRSEIVVQWRESGYNPANGLFDKRLEYIEKRLYRIEDEIEIINALNEFGIQLRAGQLPDPHKECEAANRILAVFYKRKFEEAMASPVRGNE